MSLTSGVFQVHTYINKLIPVPYHCNSTNQRFEVNSNYDKSYFKIFRTSVLLISIFVYIPLCMIRFTWLSFHWNSYSSRNIEQFFIYGFGICLMLIFVPAYFILTTQNKQVIFMMNQVCQLGSFYMSNRNHKFSFKVQIFGYVIVQRCFPVLFSMPFALVLPTFFYAPFLFPFLPLQLVFGQSSLVKIVSAIVYCSTAAYGASNILSVLLVVMVFLENIISYVSNISRDSAFSKKLFFVVCVGRLRNAQILIKLCNDMYNPFFPILLFIGILLASCCSYGTAKMHNRMTLIAYISLPAVTISCFGVALLLTYLANIPYKISKLFRKSWSPHLTKKEHQKMLRTCKPFGFQVGPYGMVSAKLGLCICDDKVRNTAAVILLDSA